MDPYDFRADLLDTFESAPDAIKALVLIVPALVFVATLGFLLHHLRLCRQIERDYEDLREARWIQRERWLQGGDPDFRRRLEEAFEAARAERHGGSSGGRPERRLGLLGKWPKDGERRELAPNLPLEGRSKARSAFQVGVIRKAAVQRPPPGSATLRLPLRPPLKGEVAQVLPPPAAALRFRSGRSALQ